MTRSVEVAPMLRRMALALLDAVGEGVAAALVQQAIDAVGTIMHPDLQEAVS